MFRATKSRICLLAPRIICEHLSEAETSSFRFCFVNTRIVREERAFFDNGIFYELLQAFAKRLDLTCYLYATACSSIPVYRRFVMIATSECMYESGSNNPAL
jgi:hypothetical protein